MPANLSALIRYKTIDLCLSNRNRQWTIKDLMAECSDALREHRGIRSGVSERTLRDDIRVMRSNILGFNAPIKQRNGVYYYSDPSYSIFQVSAVKTKLLKRILTFMLEIRAEMDHPELEIMIGKLAEIIPYEDEVTGPAGEPSRYKEEKPEEVAEDEMLREEAALPSDYVNYIPSGSEPLKARKKVAIPSRKKEKKIRFTFSWKNVLELI